MPGDCAPAGLIYSRRRDRWEPESKTMQEDFTVKNIKCGGCVKAIQNGLQAVAGVAAVDVSIDSGKVSVHGEHLDRTQLAATLSQLGYPEA